MDNWFDLGVDEHGWRIGTNPILNRQPQNQVLTDFVLTSSPEMDERMPGDDFFPRVAVTRYLFEILRTRGEEMVPTESLRGPRAQMRFVDFAFDKTPSRLYRHTLAALIDEDELENADYWDVAAKAALVSREQVRMDLERRKAAIVANTANYGLVINMTSGNGWNQAGTMQATIDEAATFLEDTVGVERQQLQLALAGNSKRAALLDPNFNASRAFVKGADAANLNDVQAHVDVGKVWSTNKLYKPTISATPVKMYGNVAVLYYPGNRARLSRMQGGRAWTANFYMGEGGALTPFYVYDRTSWAYPWQARERPDVLSTECAVLITNAYRED